VKPRTALCLDCRTALTPGESCDAHPRARAVDLANPADRNRALDAVWGPPHLRMRTAAKAGGLGGGAGGIFEGCGGCGELGSIEGEAAVALLVVVVAAFVAIGLYLLIKHIVYWIREYRARPRPAGSAWKPLHPQRTVRGTIVAVTGGETIAPLTATPCAAWGLVLEHDRATGGRVMLRDGETRGMTIRLDDGRTLELPAGRVRVDGKVTETRSASAGLLKTIDPHHVAHDERAILANDDGHETRLAVGDALEITGGLVEQFATNAPATFRESAPTELVLAGVPSLRRI